MRVWTSHLRARRYSLSPLRDRHWYIYTEVIGHGVFSSKRVTLYGAKAGTVVADEETSLETWDVNAVGADTWGCLSLSLNSVDFQMAV